MKSNLIGQVIRLQNGIDFSKTPFTSQIISIFLSPMYIIEFNQCDFFLFLYLFLISVQNKVLYLCTLFRIKVFSSAPLPNTNYIACREVRPLSSLLKKSCPEYEMKLRLVPRASVLQCHYFLLHSESICK